MPQAEVNAAREEGSALNRRWHVRKDGSRVFIDGTVVALRDAAGALRGFQKIGQDVTKRRQAEEEVREYDERQAFLLKLADELRSLASVASIQGAVCNLVAQHLHADRAYYVEVRHADGLTVVEQDYVGPGLPSLVGTYPLSAFQWALDLYSRGDTVVIDDVTTSPLIPQEQRPAAAGAHVAWIAVPLIRAGRLVGAFCVARMVPHHWTSVEKQLAESVAERCWGAIERARAEAALKEREARQSFLLKLSDALRPLTDTEQIQKTAARILGQHLGAVRVHYVEALSSDQNLLTGGPGYVVDVPEIVGVVRISDFDDEAQATYRAGRTLIIPDVEAVERSEAQLASFRALGIRAALGVPLAKAGRLIGILSVHRSEPHDWTLSERVLVEQTAERTWEALERARAEAALREAEERQAYLLKLSDLLRPLADPAEITETATRFLGERVGASRAYYAEWAPGATYGEISRDYAFPGLQSLAGRYPIEAFRSAYDQISKGRTWIVEDNATAPGISPDERAYHEKVGVISWVDVPLTKRGAPVAVLCVVYDKPRKWTEAEIDLIEETAERCWGAIERARTEGALRQSEARLAAAFESVPVGVAVVDTSGEALVANSGYRRFVPTGVIPSRHPPSRGRWRAWDGEGKLVKPEDFPSARALRGERVVPGLEMIYTDDDGTGIWTRVSSVPIFDSSGQVSGVATVVTDIDAEKRSSEALREREERLRAFGDASSDVLWVRDAETLAWEYLSPAFESIYGLSREVALRGDTFAAWLELIVPDDRDRARGEIEKVRRGEAVGFEYRIVRPADGEVRLLRDTDFPMRDTAGRITRIGGIGQDITEEKRTADRMEMMVKELQHRTRNLIAVVRSIASQTLALTGPTPAFAEQFNDRLEALGRVQGLLSRSDEAPITIETLVRMELDALGRIDAAKDRMMVSGPYVRLRNSIVQSLSLGLHELATNARKYGAFATDNGRLAVTWALRESSEGGRRLWIEWTESGRAATPGGLEEARRGYGRELIERALPYALSAETTYTLEAEGLRCTIELPLDRRERRRRS